MSTYVHTFIYFFTLLFLLLAFFCPYMALNTYRYIINQMHYLILPRPPNILKYDLRTERQHILISKCMISGAEPPCYS
jgi:hypothetical protein